MKTLANCSPKEFLKQTNKIRKSVANWLSLTKILEIRKELPEIANDATPEERKAALQAQANKNATAILDAILDEHPDETAELLGLMCFIEPDDLDNHSMAELIGSFNEIIGCKEVIDFFTSLMHLESVGILNTANQ